MKLHLDSPATSSRRNLAVRSNHVRLGTLALAVVFTASQMPAQSATAATPQAATQQTADTSAVSTPVTATNATTAVVPSAPSDASMSESSSLPEAPTAKTGSSSESASVTMPPDMKAMMIDAAQQSQSLAAPKSKGIQRPGMLVMGIIGLPIAALGAWALSVGVTKDATAKNVFGASLLGGGGVMAGFGFYYAFKPQNK